MTKLVLRRYRPHVIALAGSLGKTTTKQAIMTVLAKATTVQGGALHDNDRHAALRTLLQGGFLRALALLFRRDPSYPKVVLLEYRAREEATLLSCGSLAEPNSIVLTSLAPANLATLRSIDRLTKAITAFLHCGKRDGWTLLNADDAAVVGLKGKVRGRFMTYGLSESADVRAIEIAVDQVAEGGSIVVRGTSFKLVYKGSAVPIHLPGVLGGPHISAALAAAAMGIIFDMNLVQIAEALQSYMPTPGRMRLLPGIKRTLLIDDTYTASPVSCMMGLEGLDVLAVRPGGEKFAVLGDMVPLGEYTEQGHREMGERVAAIGADYLVTVGKFSRDMGRAAREKGMPEERVYHFTTPEEAGRFLQNRLEEGDCLYVSGSETMRMERIVKEIMAEPMKADALLVRR